MLLMLMNATMPQKSTEHYKISLPKSVVMTLQATAMLLEERRLIKHTQGDALLVAMESVLKLSRNNVKIIARFYADSEEELVPVKMRRDVKERVFEEAKALNCTAKALVYAVSTIFIKAALASFWKNNRDYSAVKSKFPDFKFNKPRNILNVRSVKSPRLQHKKPTLIKDVTVMRHYNYMEEFRSFMQQYGGIDSWCNKNLTLPIHTFGIKGNVGKAQDDDQEKNENPMTEHTMRLWKRGRGYNITIHGYGSSRGDNAPHLEIGSVHRLYDVYRHIDWSKLSTLQEDVQE